MAAKGFSKVGRGRRVTKGVGKVNKSTKATPSTTKIADVGKTTQQGWGKAAKDVSGKQIKISSEGIESIERHLATMDFDQANQVMIKRLKDINSGVVQPTNVDFNFYSHELREMELMKQGMKYPEAHARALRDYGIEYKKGYEAQLYTQEAINLGDVGLDNATRFKKSDLL